MCVIIAHPSNAHLEKDRAKRLWNRNPDGGGFAFIKDGKIEVQKFMDFPNYWRAFETARSAHPKAGFLLHMRITTHGDTNLENTHPYAVDEHTVMAHNGIIHGVPDYKDGRSDTKVFVDEVLSGLPEDWLDNKYIVDMVEEWIGWSKLMFLTTNPKLNKNVYILNEHKGHEKDGMWFSNNMAVDAPVALAKQHDYTGFNSHSGAVGHWNTKGVWEEGTMRHKQADMLDSCEPKALGRRELGGDSLEAFLAEENFELSDIEHHTKLLIAERKKSWNNKPIAWMGMDFGYECLGCDEAVSETTGECDCWSKICLDCERFAAECICEQGYSAALVIASKADGDLMQRAFDAVGLEEQRQF